MTDIACRDDRHADRVREVDRAPLGRTGRALERPRNVDEDVPGAEARECTAEGFHRETTPGKGGFEAGVCGPAFEARESRKRLRRYLPGLRELVQRASWLSRPSSRWRTEADARAEVQETLQTISELMQ